MKPIAKMLLTVLLLCGLAAAQKPSDTAQQLTQSLHDFLNGAAKGDKAAFERFFAEDVIYTRGIGAVMDRATILKDVAPPKPGEPVQTYGAEDIVVHQTGDVAILNFRLVVNTDDKGKKTTQFYRNTGTFQQRGGQWKVIAWQATPIVERSETSK